MSDMRPMSVLVGDRRIMDESNAEKIFHEAIAFCKQVYEKQHQYTYTFERMILE